MKTPLALLLLALSLPAVAGTPKAPEAPRSGAAPAEPPSVAVEEPSGYWTSSNGVSWWGDVKSRRSITLVDDLPRLREICMVPPAADWVTEGATPEVEEKYLLLLSRLNLSLDSARGSHIKPGRLSRCGVASPGREAYLGEYSNTFNGVNPEEIRKRTNFAGCRAGLDKVKGHPKYASQGNVLPNVGLIVMETVNALLKSKNPGTVRMALGVVQELANGDKFADTLESMVKDKGLTAKVNINPEMTGKETLTLRVYAMRALAATNPTERTAKLLALVWHDSSEPEDVRVGALRAFSFVVEDARLEKPLFPFLNPLMGLNADENDKKDEAGPKAKLSELGDAAYCVASGWPREKRDFAKKGLDWDGNAGTPIKKSKSK